MEDDGGAEPVNREQLADELRQLMTLRSRTSVRDRACPELDRLLVPGALASRDSRYVEIARLLDSAAAAIHDQSHRAAATALFGSGEGRWRTVAQRGAEAAAAFGCGWDAYRRRRTSGTSQLDDTLRSLVDTMVRIAGPQTVSVAGSGAPASAPSTAVIERQVQPVVIATPPAVTENGHQPPSSTGGPGVPTGDRDTRRTAVGRYRVLAGLVLIVLVGGAAYLVTRGSDDPDDSVTDPVCSLLDQQVGDLPDGATPEMRAWSARFRAFARTLPRESVQCAGVMEWRHDLVIQPIAEPAPLGVGAIVAADEAGASLVRLDYLEYWTYRTHLDQYGVEMVGTPIQRDDRHDTTVVMLTRGAIVGEAPPVSFLIMGTVWQEWIDSGGLDGDMGRPISTMRDEQGWRVQDFERGRLAISLADPSDVVWKPTVNAETALPKDIRKTVLRAEDGTSWYVDEDLVRHWLPTTNDYRCTSGLGPEMHTAVPAQAIATLTAGAPLRCR